MCDDNVPAIHVDDIGTQFEVTIVDENGDIVNLTAATLLEITFKKPRGGTLVVATPDVTVLTDGTDGIITYTTVSGDLDQAGVWYMQGRIVTLTTEFHSSIDNFEVIKNL